MTQGKQGRSEAWRHESGSIPEAIRLFHPHLKKT